MSIIVPANTLAATGSFDVDNSCRFDDGSSAHMHITPDSDGSRVAWTFSTWIKRCALGAMPIFSTPGNTSNIYDEFYFNASDKIQFSAVVSGTQYALRTKRVFRDTSAWYHIVLIFDSNNSTAGNRMQLWINGVRTAEGDFEDITFKDAQNYNSSTNKSGYIIYLGRVTTNTAGYYDGYMSEVVFQNAAVDSPVDKFGEFDEDSGIWKPIDVSGLTFGTNGFYLDYEASGNLGNDVNGGTDLTESGLAATDQSLDTCTNNFNTYSTLWGMQAIRVPTFAEGNLKITGDGDAQHHQVMGTFAVNKGKWYWEAKFTVSADIGKNKVGIMSVDLGSPQTAEIVDQSGSCVFVNEDGGDFRRDNATVDQNSGVFTQNQIIGVALNMDDGEISIYRDNSLIVDALDIGNADGTYVTPASVHYRDAGMEFNFGSAPYALTSAAADGDGFGAFEFAPPSGYFALCSKNLAEYG